MSYRAIYAPIQAQPCQNSEDETVPGLYAYAWVYDDNDDPVRSGENWFPFTPCEITDGVALLGLNINTDYRDRLQDKLQEMVEEYVEHSITFKPGQWLY